MAKIKVKITAEEIINFFREYRELNERYENYPFPNRYIYDEYDDEIPERVEEVLQYHREEARVYEEMKKRGAELGMLFMDLDGWDMLKGNFHLSLTRADVHLPEKTLSRPVYIDDDCCLWVEVKYWFYLKLHREEGAGPLLPMQFTAVDMGDWTNNAIYYHRGHYDEGGMQELWGVRQDRIDFRKELIRRLAESL